MSFINILTSDGYLRTPKIIKAFKKIKRADFVLPKDVINVEVNAPLPIGHGQTISQPATVAFMLELLSPKEGESILDVGTGSGWTTALLAEIVGKKGKVYGLELIDELREFGEINVSKYNFIKHGIADMRIGDGYHGLPELAPFDKILVSAASLNLPEKLLRQLKVGGRLVIPIGEKKETQEIVVIDKIKEGEFTEERYPGYVFVPLVRKF